MTKSKTIKRNRVRLETRIFPFLECWFKGITDHTGQNLIVSVTCMEQNCAKQRPKSWAFYQTKSLEWYTLYDALIVSLEGRSQRLNERRDCTDPSRAEGRNLGRAVERCYQVVCSAK